MNSLIQIKNPVSQFHCVRLHPFQNLSILLTTPNYRNPNLKIISNFIELIEEQKTEEQLIYFLKQKVDISNWICLTTFCLGTIHLISDFYSSSFCVLSESTNKEKVTVVNPKDEFVFLSPNQILEVVVYDFDKYKEWQTIIFPGIYGIKVEKFSHEGILPNQSFIQSKTIEYHYLFRFEAESIDIIRNLENGTFSGGRILFVTEKETTFQFSLDIVLKLRKGKSGSNKVILPTIKRNIAMISKIDIQEIKNDLEENCKIFYNEEK